MKPGARPAASGAAVDATVLVESKVSGATELLKLVATVVLVVKLLKLVRDATVLLVETVDVVVDDNDDDDGGKRHVHATVVVRTEQSRNVCV